MKLVLPKVKPRDLIADNKWTLFPGDLVQVIGGTRASEVGKEGKVLDVVRKLNSVTVDGVKTNIKHIRPNPIRPRGGRIEKPMPIHFSNLKLVDPHVNKITDAKLVSSINRETGRLETYRLLKESGTKLPIPEDDGPVDKYESSIHDTPKSLLAEKTWEPTILKTPFPARFLNQMERNRRFGLGSREF
ncbi:translation protein SH3-like domain-containing protein [Obelidium mucronatum]|nr:translation protein SH3-like domain-containing protein [Obelidium mucronatum]